MKAKFADFLFYNIHHERWHLLIVELLANYKKKWNYIHQLNGFYEDDDERSELLVEIINSFKVVNHFIN